MAGTLSCLGFHTHTICLTPEVDDEKGNGGRAGQRELCGLPTSRYASRARTKALFTCSRLPYRMLRIAWQRRSFGRWRHVRAFIWCDCLLDVAVPVRLGSAIHPMPRRVQHERCWQSTSPSLTISRASWPPRPRRPAWASLRLIVLRWPGRIA